jgi:hypothetical protein
MGPLMEEFKAIPLAEFMKEVGHLEACIFLRKPNATLVSRRNSKKNWVVVDYNGKKRCAMIDD